MKDVNKILDKLEELYPDAKCELDYTCLLYTSRCV